MEGSHMPASKAEHYSSIPRIGNFTGGLTIRDWLTGQSFEDQYRFGKAVLERLQRALPSTEEDSGRRGEQAAIAIARDDYRRRILEWEEARRRSIFAANLLAKAMQGYALAASADADWRKGVESLLKDRVPGVRLAAAVETLRWNPKLGGDAVKDVSKHDKTIYGLEAETVLRELKAERLDLDWRPAAPPGSAGQPGPARPSPVQLDAVVALHSTIMSGGFFYALAAYGPQFTPGLAGYEASGLDAAAVLLRRALAVLPWDHMPLEHDDRAALIDALPDEAGAALEELAGSYHDLFPRDSVLFEALERAAGPDQAV
jgi:hypothetical protein